MRIKIGFLVLALLTLASEGGWWEPLTTRTRHARLLIVPANLGHSTIRST